MDAPSRASAGFGSSILCPIQQDGPGIPPVANESINKHVLLLESICLRWQLLDVLWPALILRPTIRLSTPPLLLTSTRLSPVHNGLLYQHRARA